MVKNFKRKLSKSVGEYAIYSFGLCFVIQLGIYIASIF